MNPFRNKKAVPVALCTAMIAATIGGLSTPVSADEDQFRCDPGFYQVISGQLAELDPAAENYKTIGEDLSNYNAMGYRISDGLLYGISGSTLYRVNAKGIRTDVGQLSQVKGAYTGDFDDEGLLNVSRGGRDWYKINVDTLEETYIPEFSSYTAVADVTNVHGVFFGVSSDGGLYSYDQTSLEAKEVGMVSGLPGTLKSYGAAWATAGGNLYVGRNSGEIYQITGYTTSSPKATLVGRAPATNSNDGASCSLAVPQAGLNDVDGPEPESPPRTTESKEASDTYKQDYETVSATFTPIEPDPEPEPEPKPDSGTYEAPDAALGTGPGCEAGGAVDRPVRDEDRQFLTVSSATEVFSTGFDANSLSLFTILSGSWTAADGSLLQNHDCGYDYSVLLKDQFVNNFSWEATFSAVDTFNQGGIVFNQSSTNSRSGAMVVDLADYGQTLRWGEYDTLGYYQFIGSVPVTAPTSGQNVTLSVEVHGNDVVINYNGQQVATATSTHSGGMVGLVASLTAVSYDSARLVALPAPAEPAPAETTTTETTP